MSAVVQDELAVLSVGLDEHGSRPAPIGAAAATRRGISRKKIVVAGNVNNPAAAAAANGSRSAAAIRRDGAGAGKRAHGEPDAPAGAAAAAGARTVAAIRGNGYVHLQCASHREPNRTTTCAADGIRRIISTAAARAGG